MLLREILQEGGDLVKVISGEAVVREAKLVAMGN